LQKQGNGAVHKLQAEVATLKKKLQAVAKPELANEGHCEDSEDEDVTAEEIRAQIKVLKSNGKRTDLHPVVAALQKQLADKEKQALGSQPGPVRMSKAEARIAKAKRAVQQVTDKQAKNAADQVRVQERHAALVAEQAQAAQEVVEAEQALDLLLRELQAVPAQPPADDGVAALATVALTLPPELLGAVGMSPEMLQQLLLGIGTWQKQQRAEQVAAEATARAAAAEAAKVAAAAVPPPAADLEHNGMEVDSGIDEQFVLDALSTSGMGEEEQQTFARQIVGKVQATFKDKEKKKLVKVAGKK